MRGAKPPPPSPTQHMHSTKANPALPEPVCEWMGQSLRAEPTRFTCPVGFPAKIALGLNLATITSQQYWESSAMSKRNCKGQGKSGNEKGRHQKAI